MNTKQKELELAKLLDWEISNGSVMVHGWHQRLCPYHTDGLSQFAAILLAFPEIIDYKVDVTSIATGKDMGTARVWEFNTFNQENILDQILVMKGIME